MAVPGKNIDHAKQPATTMMKIGKGTEGSWLRPNAFAATAILLDDGASLLQCREPRRSLTLLYCQQQRVHVNLLCIAEYA
jgi:hypothetical protein